MPLLDHFHAPLHPQRHWESFHAAWAGTIADVLNEELLPEGFFAEEQAHAGGRVEIDVATFEASQGGRGQARDGATATLPARVVWNPETRRDLEQVLRRFRPDVVHVHNTFPVVSPSILYACRDERVPVVVTLHNYKLLCASGDFFRDGEVCHDCAGGNPMPALVHRCYRGSVVATVPTVVAARVHRRAWRRPTRISRASRRAAATSPSASAPASRRSAYPGSTTSSCSRRSRTCLG